MVKFKRKVTHYKAFIALSQNIWHKGVFHIAKNVTLTHKSIKFIDINWDF